MPVIYGANYISKGGTLYGSAQLAERIIPENLIQSDLSHSSLKPANTIEQMELKQAADEH